MKEQKNMKQVGKPVLKSDGIALATGAEKFVSDDLPNGTLIAKILTSPHAHANIRRIDVEAARALPGVHAVLTYKDVPRVAHTTAGQGFPEPSAYDTFTLDKKVRYVGDRVAAVAAETAEIAIAAMKLIDVDYEVLPAILDPRLSMKPDAPRIHDEPEAHMPIPVPYDPSRNMAAQCQAEVGDFDRAMAEEADVVVQGEFIIQQASHCAMEPHVAMAYIDPRGRLVIRTSTQVPFHVRRIVAQRLEIPISRVRVIKPRIGGGFGGKQEVLLEDIVGALALATDKPVLLDYNRAEEFVSSRTRHPQILRVKAGARNNGTLVGYDLDILMDTGAYGSHALTVVCNSGSKTLPLYRWETIRFRGTSVYTNLPVGGAYRGYGATQAYFPLEVLMDELAEKLGMDPLELRRMNHIQEGESSPIFEALGEGKPGVSQSVDSVGLDQCIELGAKAIGWEEKRKRPKDKGPIKRGIGVACLMQGSSIPEIDMGSAYLKMNEDGGFNLQVGATDLGTGSDTVLAQIAAEALAVKTERIQVYSSDTDLTPFDVGAYASSTTYLTGNAVRKAAEDAAQQIAGVAAAMLECSPDDIVLENETATGPDGRSVTYENIGMRAMYETDQFQIQSTASHVSHKSPAPFSAHFTEVEVDTETGKVKVLEYIAAVDCGTAINPTLAEGQMEGSVVNGISYALTEEYLYDPHGKLRNSDFNYYKIYSAADLPKIKTILVPTWEPTGPYGAKSVSEIGINGPVPAIANAIYDAVGVRLYEAPFTSERILRALKKL